MSRELFVVETPAANPAVHGDKRGDTRARSIDETFNRLLGFPGANFAAPMFISKIDGDRNEKLIPLCPQKTQTPCFDGTAPPTGGSPRSPALRGR